MIASIPSRPPIRPSRSSIRAPPSSRARLAAVASMAVEVASTPGGARGLGVELDPTLRYVTTNGFAASLEYAALFPLAGLDNPVTGQSARPAQLLRLRLAFRY